MKSSSNNPRKSKTGKKDITVKKIEEVDLLYFSPSVSPETNANPQAGFELGYRILKSTEETLPQ